MSLQPQERDYRLTLQAQVTDEAADPISGAASLIAYRADLVLGSTLAATLNPLTSHCR